MMIKRFYRMKRYFGYAMLIGALSAAAVSAAKTVVPVFLFSGQSNMVGLGASASTADQKKTVENVKVDCRTEGTTKKWSILGPGFGGSGSSQFGPELYFGRTLADSMATIKFAFIKDAFSGTWLGKPTEWLPPSSNNGTGGKLYNDMMNHVDNALKSFNSAFDTAQYTPRWAGFIWLQGEFDAMGPDFSTKSPVYADKYDTNLTNLIKDIRTKTGIPDLPIILPMIVAATNNWPYSAKIRAADVAMTVKFDNCDTMDVKDFKLSDGIHYDAPSMEKIGRICAQRWLAMKYTKDWWTTTLLSQPGAYTARTSRYTPNASLLTTMYDLRGRSIGTTASMHATHARGIFIARIGDAASGVCRPIANLSR